MFNLGTDQLIFFCFLTIFLIFGLLSSHGVKSFREYAVGNKTFPIAILIATNVAATLSGSGFFCDLSETYNNGLYYLWAAIGGVIVYYLIVGLILIPRMGEFMNNISLAEAMGEMFGKEVRFITSIAGFLAMSSLIAMQFKVIGKLCQYGLGISSDIGIILMGLIITIYSSIGGIKSVTFTDLIQFITFGTILPILAFFLYKSSFSQAFNIFNHNELYNVKEVFNFTNTKSLSFLSLFFVYSIPTFKPSSFQQIVIAKDINQARKSYLISCLLCLIVIFISCFISLVVYSQNPNLHGDEVFNYTLINTGKVMRGLTLVGVLAMIMSTADSYINSISVTFVHDVFQPLNIKYFEGKELNTTKFIAFIIGCMGIFLSIKNHSILSLLKLGNMFLASITAPPFLMALFGFRPHKYCVMTGMLAGIMGTAVWAFIINFPAIDSLIPGMLSNFIILILSHYLFNLPGGWTGIKDNKSLKEEKQKKSLLLANIKEDFKNFSLKNFFLSIGLKNEYLYLHFGLYSTITALFNVFTVSSYLILYQKFIYFLVILFCINTILILHPLWKYYQESGLLISIIWFFSIIYSFFTFNFIVLLISNIAPFQLLIFLISTGIICLTFNKKISTSLYLIGLILTFVIYKLFFKDLLFNKIMLGFVLFGSSILLIFLDQKDSYIDLIKLKLKHYSEIIKFNSEELNRALNLKYEFINKVTHEHNAPLTGIISLSESLKYAYDRIDDAQRKEAINHIYNSANRLNNFQENLIILGKLNHSIQLSAEQFNLSNLLLNRIDKCKKVYISDETQNYRTFINNIEANIIFFGDKYYIKKMLDNLITNAINYCLQGKIEINLNIHNNKVCFSINDEGIGVPKDELQLIFEEFRVSSLSYTPAEGRGIGLSVCRKVVEAHGGLIWAKRYEKINYYQIGFYFEIPLMCNH